MKLCIGHLYPDLMNLYGDRGNVMVLFRRCMWRSIDVEVRSLRVGDRADMSEFDILFIGGGQDFEQRLIYRDLLERGENLRAAVGEGLVLLAVCGGYQLLGNYYKTFTGEVIEGIHLFDVYTLGERKRMVGNVVVSWEHDGVRTTMVGFENHGGKTYLGETAVPLGYVKVGYGNNGSDRTEGCRYKNAFGTYLHGPVLSKNPLFADLLISLALERKYGSGDLPSLDDRLEALAHKRAIEVARRKSAAGLCRFLQRW